MSRNAIFAICAAVALASGATISRPTEAHAGAAIWIGDRGYGGHGSGYGGGYDSYDDDDDDHQHYHHHDHYSSCRWQYRRVPSYHWHDGHYGRHGYEIKKVRICNNY